VVEGILLTWLYQLRWRRSLTRNNTLFDGLDDLLLFHIAFDCCWTELPSKLEEQFSIHLREVELPAVVLQIHHLSIKSGQRQQRAQLSRELLFGWTVKSFGSTSLR
jgi:hypothetical protein